MANVEPSTNPIRDGVEHDTGVTPGVHHEYGRGNRSPRGHEHGCAPCPATGQVGCIDIRRVSHPDGGRIARRIQDHIVISLAGY